jgi:hypothetical protein
MRNQLSTELAALYARDLTRLLQELRAFPNEDALWTTMPGVSNAAGTLALHLEGNLRDFIGRQLGHIDYTRNRPLEFSRRGVPQAELIARIEGVRDLVPRVIAGLSGEQLGALYPDQVFGAPIATQQFLIHLNGHLNYHLGQIDYLRRITTGADAIPLADLEPWAQPGGEPTAGP